jgi:hypothetical protein
MKFFRTIGVIGVICCAAISALGQVTLELALDQAQYLQNESLVVKAKITNFSGRTLRLGGADDWLSFHIERKHGVVSRISAPPVKGEFDLENATTGTKRVDLMPHFELARPDHYTLSATIDVPGFGPVSSKPVEFDVITGSKLWDLNFGVPGTANTNAPPEIRKYALIQAIHLQKLRLYLRVSDASENTIYRVFPVGQMVNYARPEPQLDKESNLHLLFQSGARSFSYHVVSPNGEILVRQTHEIAGTRPALRPQAEGRIRVVGGARRITSADLPPPAAAKSSIDAPGQ